jgi:hypothetical protein
MAYSLVVLAAGMGSRYGGLKQLDGFGPNRETLLEYAIYDALQHHFDEVIFVIRRETAETFKTLLGDRISLRTKVRYAFQTPTALHRPSGQSISRPKSWGTIHALLAAQELISQNFAVINADDFYGSHAFALFQLPNTLPDTVSTPVQGCMIGYPLRHVLSEHGVVSRGLCYTDAESDYLTKIVEATAVARQADGKIYAQGIAEPLLPDLPVSMNFWGFEPRVLPLFADLFDEFVAQHPNPEEKAECYISSSVNELIARGLLSVRVLPNVAAEWLGVTYIADKPAVAKQLQVYVAAGNYPSPLFG